MKKRFITTNIDEFNYIYASSLDAYNFKKQNKDFELYTSTFENFDIMLPDYDKIYVQNYTSKSGTNLIEDISLDRNIFYNMEKIGKKRASKDVEIEFLGDEDVAKFRGGDHVYKYMFSHSTKRLLENDLVFINPKKSDYEECVSFLNSINVENKKIIAINGRNLNKILHRNNLYHNTIIGLIRAGYFVVNLTINPAISFSKMLSFYLASNCVISIADSGGANVNCLTEANYIFLGGGGWIDNPEFGYNGTTLVEARKKYKNFITEHFFSDSELFDFLKNIGPKKEHTNFFDENKIEFI
jgi:hypothetical protein